MSSAEPIVSIGPDYQTLETKEPLEEQCIAKQQSAGCLRQPGWGILLGESPPKIQPGSVPSSWTNAHINVKRIQT